MGRYLASWTIALLLLALHFSTGHAAVPQVVAGCNHNVVINSDGTLWAWGRNDYGQLGVGTTVDHPAPVQVGTGTDWQTIAAGGFHTVAIKSDGTLWAWGHNVNGQLGDGSTTYQFSPIRVGTDSNWQMVSAGFMHTVAIKSDGTLWAWGHNPTTQFVS